MIGSFSVIVPAFRCEDYIVRTLESIETSIAQFQDRHPHASQVQAQVVVVNDASPDQTLTVIESFVRSQSRYGSSHYTLVSHARSLGAGPARNTGAKVSTGEILFFCDGDDLFLPDHIYACYRALNGELPLKSGSTVQLDERVLQPDMISELNEDSETSPNTVSIVSTQTKIEEDIHPSWKSAVENSLLINLCLRRDCHDFVEGFPEASTYKQIRGREDITYRKWLARFFTIYRLGLETVEYIRYPGNSFDRQMEKFQMSPKDYKPNWPKDEAIAHAIADRIEADHVYALRQKLARLQLRFIPVELVHWSSLVTEALTEKRYPEAIAFYERGVAVEPDLGARFRDQLARAYNNLAAQQHQQGKLDQAAHNFEQSLELKPNYPPEDLAKIHFNLGMVAQDQKDYAKALNWLQQAAQLDANLPQVRHHILRLNYLQSVQQHGYQFTQDWFSNNLLVWQTFIAPLAGQEGLKVLEIGSWEGRSTCWLLENILTHDTATITCIDTFEGSYEHQQFNPDYLQTVESRFDFNITQTQAGHKVEKCIGRSQTMLRTLPLATYDILYIDGSHVAGDVLQDAMLGWDLIKVGGLIIFDDYGFSFGQPQEGKPALPQNPKVGVDAVLNLFGDRLKVLYKGYQVLVRKLQP